MSLIGVVADGRSFDELTTEEKRALASVTEIGPAERSWFASHWLRIAAEAVERLNDRLPQFTRISGILAGSEAFIGADLLTDCDVGGTYENVAAELRALPLVEWAPDSV